jgi:diguanylate cyclase (GGDEF)-like protein
MDTDMQTDHPAPEKNEDIIKLVSDHEKEKQCLLRVIHTYGLLVETIPDFADDVKEIKSLLQQAPEDQCDDIGKKINQLRNRIFSRELSAPPGDPAGKGPGADGRLRQRVTEMVRMLRRVTDFFLENFYPVEGTLEQKARSIRIDLDPHVPDEEIDGQVTAFLEYSQALKQKILLDFSSVNAGFQDLLTQVSQLESVISTEFNAEDKEKRFQSFENSIGREMGAISEAFALKKNFNELKTAVISRLKTIREIVEQKKESEKKQLEKANDTIKKLKKKISVVEAMAEKFSSKAQVYRKQALFDALTGVNNRKSFDQKIERELAMLDDTDPMALIVFDINAFKWINDSFGHVAGDRVLQVVADSLKKNFRQSDFVARYGGDEFVVLVNGLRPDKVRERIQRFKSLISRIKFVSHARQMDIKVSISAGMAMASPGESAASLLHRADQAMYEDKNTSAAENGGSSV